MISKDTWRSENVLQGVTKEWFWSNYDKTRLTWNEFRKQFIQVFQPQDNHSIMKKIYEEKQKSNENIQAYGMQLKNLGRQANPSMPESFLISVLIMRLRNN
jgi:hypothetical protein